MKKVSIGGSLFWVCLILLCNSCSSNMVSAGDAPKLAVLPDGTRVVLNKAAEIEYIINETQRLVHLRGEAFFKVKKAAVPFEVHTANGVIKVLGTSFSVHSSDKGLAVEVDEGLVEVQAGNHTKKLRKGERAVYNGVKHLMEQGKAEFKHRIWTEAFKKDMRRLGKEIESEGKKLGKEIKNVSKDFKIKL